MLLYLEYTSVGICQAFVRGIYGFLHAKLAISLVATLAESTYGEYTASISIYGVYTVATKLSLCNGISAAPLNSIGSVDRVVSYDVCLSPHLNSGSVDYSLLWKIC